MAVRLPEDGATAVHHRFATVTLWNWQHLLPGLFLAGRISPLPPHGTGWRRPRRRSKTLPMAMRRLATAFVEGEGGSRKDAKGEAGCVLSWCLCVLSEAGVRNPSVGAAGGGMGNRELGTGDWGLLRPSLVTSSATGLGTGDWGLGTRKKPVFKGAGPP